MAGYTRQSAAQILNGEIVSAPPLNAEFNQVLAAFNNSTGHKHDGSAAEGPPIDRIADADQRNLLFVDTSTNQINFFVEVSSTAVGQISVQDGAILPFTDDDISIGSTAFEFKDLFIDGTANIDALVADTADINGGTIDNATIGATTPAAGAFTTITATNLTIVGSASTIGAVAFTSTGATVTGNLTVSANITADNITVVGSASTIGALAITSTTATLTGDMTVSGNITASTIGAVNITVTGSASSIGALAITSTTATLTGDLTVSGTVTATTLAADNISVTGSASTIGALAITSTSAQVNGDFTVTGTLNSNTSIAAQAITVTDSISADNITIKGSASSIGAASFTSTAVTITKLITSNAQITGGSITGVENIFDPGAALSYKFTSSTSDADPGNGNIALNNASSTGTTTIFIDNVDSLSSADMTQFISLLSGGNNPSSILGTVTLRKATFPEIFAQYSVTAVTNASGYQKLTVVNKGASAAAPFTSGDSLLVDIMLSGDKGDIGDLPSGAGTGNVFSSLTSTTVASGTVMKTVSTTSGTLFLTPTTITIDDNNSITGLSTLSLSGGSITIRSDSGSPGYIDMYCEVNNLHYSRLQAQPHANYSGNITITLPATSGTLALLAQKANFTDVTASTLTVSGNISADTITVTDITATGSASTIGAVAFTSTAATVTGNLTVTGSVTASSLTVNGNISASTITVADITATGSASTIGAVAFTSTGATVTGGLTVTGAVTASNITIVGSASTLGAITVTTSSVGINTAAVTSGTALEVTGNMRITTTGNGLIFPDGSKQTAAASAGIGIGKAIAMTLVFG